MTAAKPACEAQYNPHPPISPRSSDPLHRALKAPYCKGPGCENEECADNAATLRQAITSAGYVLLPRSAVEHILDWHNKQPCGVGQESLDEIVFGVLHAALWPDDANPNLGASS